MMNGELAGFTIPRLGMGTMALAIEGVRIAIPRFVRFMPVWTRVSAIWIRLGHIICRASPAPALRKTLATVKSWCVMRSLRGMAPEMQCSSPPKPDIAVLAKRPRPLTVRMRWALMRAARKASVCRPKAAATVGLPTRPETMIRDAKESALHLGVDTLDLLYSHGPDPAVPYEDQCGALKQLLDEGVIKYAGISRVNNEQIDLARSIIGSGLVAVQNQFSPSHPDPEHTMKHCAELGLAFVCWSPLGGFLDTFDQSAYDPFRTVAAQRGCSYQRVVLAWELTRYERLFTIPSARNPQEINDSFAATQLQLTQEELAMLPC